jgi:threonine/homoserine/homoserine lactone efflux protein
MASFRLARIKRSPATIVRDIFLGAALTAFNPGTMLYWLLAAGPAWLSRAQLSAGDVRVWPGLMAAVMGLCTWFASITALICFRPQKVGPRFIRVVNAACGLLLIISGSAVAVTACLKLMGR